VCTGALVSHEQAVRLSWTQNEWPRLRGECGSCVLEHLYTMRQVRLQVAGCRLRRKGIRLQVTLNRPGIDRETLPRGARRAPTRATAPTAPAAAEPQPPPPPGPPRLGQHRQQM